MKALSPYLFIHIGLDIRLLRHAHDFSVGVIAKEATTLVSNLETAEFPVSVAGAHELTAFRDSLSEEADKSRKLNSFEASRLGAIMDPLERIVHAEAQTKQIYVISETRFSLDSLTQHPNRMFADGVFAKLNLISKFDLYEAFSCLVFSRATAGAFHMLRASEAILRSYYEWTIKRGRDKNPTWANMVRTLSLKRHKRASLLQKLDFIRTNYRNPTAHPDAVYSVVDLQDLIGLCIDVINEMTKDLPEPPSH